MPRDATDPPGPADLEAMAATLEASGRYRVLRRVEPCATVTPPPGTPTRLGLLLDLENIGLDPEQDEIIELAMLPLTYGLSEFEYPRSVATIRRFQQSNPGS